MTTSVVYEAVLRAKDELSKSLNGAVGSASALSGALSSLALPTALLSGVGALGAAFAGVGTAVLDYSADQQTALRDIETQLGITGEEATKLRDISKDLFVGNTGESFEDVTAAVVEARRTMEGFAASSEEAQKASVASAITLRDAYGIEFTESLAAANTLQKEFGLTAQEAFDFLAKGQQEGLNTSGDFLDTITEYARQFSGAKFSAEAFYSALKSGQADGALGTDKIADFVKEGGILLTELGSGVQTAFKTIGKSIGEDLLGKTGQFYIQTEEDAKRVQKALTDIGLAAPSIETLLQPLGTLNEKTGEVTYQAQKFSDVYSNSVVRGIRDGSVSVAEAQQLALDGIRAMDSAVEQSAAGVAIFGTQWEDFGTNAALAIDFTASKMSDLEGATQSAAAQYQTLPNAIEGIKRAGLDALSPLGDAALALANAAIPHLFEALDGLKEGIAELGAFIEKLVSGGVPEFETLKASGVAFSEQVQGAFERFAELARAVFEGLSATYRDNQQTFDTVGSAIISIAQSIGSIVESVLGGLMQFYREHQQVIDTVLGGGFRTLLTVVTTVINSISGILEGFANLLRGDVAGAVGALRSTYEENFNAIVGLVTDLGGRALEAGRAFAENLARGLLAGMNKLLADARSKLKELTDLLPGSEPRDRSSPLANLAQRGKAMLDNFAAGFAQSNIGEVLRGVLELAAQGTQDVLRSFSAVLQPQRLEQLNEERLEAGARLSAAQAEERKAYAELNAAKERQELDRIQELSNQYAAARAAVQAAESERLAAETKYSGALFAQEQQTSALEQAFAEAQARFSDPDEANKYFKLRAAQIKELAALEEQFSQARDTNAQLALRRQIELITKAQELELAALVNEFSGGSPSSAPPSTIDSPTITNPNDVLPAPTPISITLTVRDERETSDRLRQAVRQAIDGALEQVARTGTAKLSYRS
jgi:phage-related minor tail protein